MVAIRNMHAEGRNVRARVVLILCCTILAAVLYVRAEAKATLFHDYEDRFVHPWGSIGQTVIILALCGTSGVAAAPVFRRGSRLQRVGVALLLLLAAFIVARFLFWVMRQWSAS